MDDRPSEYLSADYGAKSAAYFGNARRDWIDLLPVDRAAAILELGCGDGATGALALADGANPRKASDNCALGAAEFDSREAGGVAERGWTAPQACLFWSLEIGARRSGRTPITA